MTHRRASVCFGLAVWTLLSTAAFAQAPQPPGTGQPAAGAADDAARRIDDAVAKALPDIVAIRHQIHQDPELGNQEVKTAALVAAHLRKLGLKVETGIAKTGVVAILQGALPGPVVAVRADMDALPVTEETDLPFRSRKRATYLGQEVGVAHACGHDIHTSVQLGVASTLAAVRDQLHGTVKFIFQPAEEGPPPGERAGAELMLSEGVLDHPKPVAIFALHSEPALTVGHIGWAEGPTMAAVDQFTAHIHGKQSHGAYPHLSIDPVVMAAQAILALQTIRSRNLSPFEPSVLTVGIVRGGERFNIIPADVLLEGTVRTYKEEVRSEIERRMREILDGVTKAGGGSYDLKYVKNAPATVNQPALARRVRPLLDRAVGAENVQEVPPSMGGEDFAYFANAVPGFYFRLGTQKEGTTSGGLHTPTFRGDDGAIAVGMKGMSHLIADFLRDAQTP